MYFPKSQITTNLYTNGKEYVYVGTEKEYIGFYFKTSNGKYYTGKNPNDPPVQELVVPKSSEFNDAEEGEIGNYSQEAALYLVPDVYASSTSLNLTGNPPSPPIQVINLPTEKNYNLGEYQRYFTSKNNEVKYIEIDKKQYEKFANEEPDVDYPLYSAFKFPWIISGNRNKASNINKKTIERISFNLTLSGFNSYFKGRYDQFYKYSKNEGLYTDGNEYMNSFTKKPYKGYYHIHNGEFMVGAEHTDKPHNFLIPISEIYLQKQTGSLRITSSMDEVFDYGGYSFNTSPSIPPEPEPPITAFITTWRVPFPNDKIEIGVQSSLTYNCTIDWGDGNLETITTTTSNIIPHTYLLAGDYTVKIEGTFPRILMRSTSTGFRDKLISINNWGNMVWRTFESAFEDCDFLYRCPTQDPPNLSSVESTKLMFNRSSGNVPKLLINNINAWDTSNIIRMPEMFRESPFSQYTIKDWDVKNVVNMANMFQEASLFNESLSGWSTNSLRFMGSMFYKTPLFNQNVDHFDVSNVQILNFVFGFAEKFNQPLNSWDTSNVTQMRGTFQQALVFNQPLNNWDTSNVTNMNSMFFGAASFDQDISSWDIIKVSTATNFLQGGELSSTNYDALLIGWYNTLAAFVAGGGTYSLSPTWHFGDSKYSSGEAAAARTLLDTTFNWTITDGGPA